MSGRAGSARTVGRLRVFQMVGAALAERPEFAAEGYRLERRRSDEGTTVLTVRDGSDRLVGTLSIYAEEHADRFYGSYSRPDATHCYGSALEVDPAARGHSLGRQLLLQGLWVTGQEGRRGLKGMIATDNAVSIHVHESAGLEKVSELGGVRVGQRTIWVFRRPVI